MESRVSPYLSDPLRIPISKASLDEARRVLRGMSYDELSALIDDGRDFWGGEVCDKILAQLDAVRRGDDE